MAEKGTKKTSDGSSAKSGHMKSGDFDGVIARLNERIASLESELQSAREELHTRQEELEAQAEELEAHLEEVNSANETLEKEVRVRQLSEDALKKSQFILAKSQEMAHVGNWAWNVPTGEMKWSDESFRIFGYPPNALKTGWEWLASRVHSDDRGLLTELSAAARAGKNKGVDVRVYLPGGLVRYVNIMADKVVRDKAGEVSRVYGIFQDITERKHLEEALKEREKQLTARLNAILTPDDFGEKTISEIIDIPALQELSDSFYRLTGISNSIIGLDGTVLVGSGWQDICTQFHRIHPGTSRNCLESDTHLSGSVQEGKYELYKCKNGLWDAVTPIVVQGRHIANMFTGQFFFHDETPDYAFFERQAERYGFDKTAYLEALARVPRHSRDEISQAMHFFTKFSGMISQLSYSNVQLAGSLIRQKEAETALQEKIEEIGVQAEELETQNEEIRNNYEELQNVTRSLQESEARFSAIYEHASVGINMLSLDGRYLKVNHKFCDLTGYTREELLNLTFRDVYDAGDLAGEEKDHRRLISGEISSYNNELRCIRKDGSVIWVNSSCSHIKTGDRPAYLIRVIQDVSERKRAEDAIRKQADLIDLSPDGIMVRKLDGEVTFWSKGAETLYGWTKEEVIGAQTHALFSTRFPRPLEAIVRELKHAGRWSGELVHRTKDGREITVQSWWLASFDENGEVSEIMESNVDITGLKQIENTLQDKIEEIEVQAEELEASNEELHTNYEELNRVNRSIEESMAKMEAIFGSMNDGICIMDADQNIVSVNDAFARFHRFESKDDYVRTVREYGDFLELYTLDGTLVPMQDWPILRGFRGETAQNFEVLVKRTDTGAEWFGNYSYSPIRDNEGQIIGSVLTMRDVTERKASEEALRASEIRFRSLIQNSSDIIRIIDKSGNIVYDSPSSETILGYSPGSTIGKSPLDFIHPDDRERIRDEMGTVFSRTNPGTPSEFRIRKADGSYLDVESVGINMIGTPGVDGIVTTTRPITERKRAEEALRKNEKMLRQVIDSSPVSMVLYSESEDYYYYNRKFTETFGYTAGDVPTIHDWWVRAYPDEDYREFVRSRWYAAVDEAIKTRGSIMPQEVEVTCKDGSRRYILNAFSSIGDVNLSVLYDITDRKLAEEELKEAKAQAELYLDLMGHDISNMHQIALSQLELAEDIVRNEGKIKIEDIEMITTPIVTLQRSARLIDNVRNLQKLRAGEYRIETVDLGRVLDEVVRDYAAPGNGVTINYTMANGCLAKANPLIKEAFANLIGNAIKHSHGTPTIDVSVSKVSSGCTEYHRIIIADNGPGIPDDKKDEIFHRFRRGQTHARGTGLGLYIVKTLVENFGGRVRVENRIPGDYAKGSKFIVDLPIAEDYHE